MAEPSVNVRYSIGCGTVLLALIVFWMFSGKVEKVYKELDTVKARLTEVESKLAELSRRLEPLRPTPQ